MKNRIFMSLLLSFIMSSQVGCSSDKVGNDVEYSSLDEVCDFEEENIINEGFFLEGLSLKDIYRRSEVAHNYINYFDSYEVDYNYDEYFMSKEEVNAIYEEQNKRVNCRFVNKDTFFTLYEKIKKNSFEYLKVNPQYEEFLMDYLNSDDQDLEQGFIFEDIFYLILEEHFKDSTNNLDEDVCRMQNLKIVCDDNYPSEDIGGWYDDTENIIYLCRNNIIKCVDNYIVANDTYGDKMNDYQYKKLLARYYYSILSHEFEHVFHSRCNCVDGNLANRDLLSYSKNGDGLYYVSSLIESSAESAFINFGNEDNCSCYDVGYNKLKFCNSEYSYMDEREIESLFFLMALFNDRCNINDYYSAIGNADINALLDFFDMNNEADRYTFYKLLYIADGVNGRSNLVDKYVNEYGDFITYSDKYSYMTNIGCGYRAEIFKIVLSRLVNYTKENFDFTLKENLLLFSFIKDKIVNDASFLISTEEGLEFMYDNKFASDVIKLEEEYINFLSEYYGVSNSLVREIDMRYNKDSSLIFKALVNGEDTRYYEIDNCNVALELLDKFSLLEPIISSDDYIRGYKYFLKKVDDGMIYVSGKSLKLVK